MPVFQSLEAYWPGLQVGMIKGLGHLAIFSVGLTKELILLYTSNKILSWLSTVSVEEISRVN